MIARLPRKMRAVAFDRCGGPETLAMREMPVPVPGRGEVLVRVATCALNHMDLWVRQGIPGAPLVLPHIGGSDVAGTVVALGDAVASVQVGAEVVSAPGLSCGACPACRRGDEPSCPDYRIHGFQTQGGYAEYTVLPEWNVLPRPAGLDPAQAAAVPLVFLTAYHMLFTRGRLSGPRRVLVTGASGGIGTAAVQLAAAAGAEVIALTGSAWKAERLVSLGAARVVRTDAGDWPDEIRRATSHAGVDIVADNVGGSILRDAIGLLAPGGIAVTCGVTSGSEVSLPLRSFYRSQATLLGSFMGSRWELLEALRWIGAGKVRPVVGAMFPLEKTADAQRAMEAREHFGKIVLTVGS